MTSFPTSQTVAAVPPVYSTPVFLRFLWKQTRKLLPFAMAVTILSAAVFFLISRLATTTQLSLLATAEAGVAGVIVALAGCILAFSVEREEQTLRFLRTLPRQWLSLYLGNIAATLFCTLLTITTMLLSTWLIAGDPPATDLVPILVLSSFVVEAVAWTTFVSLLCPIPILATILACGAILAGHQLPVLLTDAQHPGPNAFGEVTLFRFILAGAVLSIDAALVRLWLGRRGRRESKLQLRPPREVVSSEASTQPTVVSTRLRGFLPRLSVGRPTNRAMSGRLLWQTVREAWPGTLATVVLGGLLAAALELLVYEGVPRKFDPVHPPIAALLVVAALCGALTFHGDQRGHGFRFLVAHACSPSVLWRVRVGAWASIIGMVLACALFLLLASVVGLGTLAIMDHLQERSYIAGDRLIFAAAESRLSDVLRYGLLQSVLAAAAAFAVGQLASMLIPSGILSVAASAFCAGIIFISTYITVWWRLPPTWHYLPLIVGCLLATRLRMKDWLTERNGWRGWTRVGLAVVIPLTFVNVSIPLLRLRQVEQADRQVAAIVDVSLLTAVSVYQQRMRGADEARRLFEAFSHELRQSFRDEEKTHGLLDDVHVETRHIDRLFDLLRLPAPPAAWSIEHETEVRHLLRGAFERALEQGDLERSLEIALALRWLQWQAFYDWWSPGSARRPHALGLPISQSSKWFVEWATMSEQSSERILSAIPEINSTDEHFPTAEDLLVAAYLDAKEIVAGASDDYLDRRGPDASLAIAAHQLPGEQLRATYALKILATLTLDYVDGWLNIEDARNSPQLSDFAGIVSIAGRDNRGKVVYRSPLMIRTLYHADRTARSSHFVSQLWGDRNTWTQRLKDWRLMQARMHATRTRLALIAYHWDHGRYPESVNDLAPDYWQPDPANRFDSEVNYTIVVLPPATNAAGEMGIEGEFYGGGAMDGHVEPANVPEPLPLDESNFELALVATSPYSRSSLRLRLPWSNEYGALKSDEPSSSESEAPATDTQDERTATLKQNRPW